MVVPKQDPGSMLGRDPFEHRQGTPFVVGIFEARNHALRGSDLLGQPRLRQPCRRPRLKKAPAIGVGVK